MGSCEVIGLGDEVKCFNKELRYIACLCEIT